MVGFLYPENCWSFPILLSPIVLAPLFFFVTRGSLLITRWYFYLWQTTDLGLCSVSQITYHGYVKKSLSGQCWTQPPPTPSTTTHTQWNLICHAYWCQDKSHKAKNEIPRVKKKRKEWWNISTKAPVQSFCLKWYLSEIDVQYIWGLTVMTILLNYCVVQILKDPLPLLSIH